MDDYRAGDVVPEDIEDYIDKWHERPDDGMPLHTYLGLSWDEYATWAAIDVLPENT